MHELSLVEQLIEECIRRTGGQPVSQITVRHASTVPADGLRQAFEMLSRGTSLEGAALDAQQFDARLHCACGFDGPLGHDDVISGSISVCPACGEVSTTGQRTAELELVDLRA
jgi:Zn finger protein HypA/HybF involved in hydrogenase expression